jgi:hypothetical protein
MPHYGVAALANGTTIGCELRLVLGHLVASEYTIYSIHYTSTACTIED